MSVDVLIPTYRRPAALAVTLATLVGQTYRDFAVTISDQTEGADSAAAPEVAAVIRVLQARGHAVRTLKHLPRRGMAEHRQFLLESASRPYALFLDDDLVLEPDAMERMMCAMERERCGFVGSAVVGLSYIDDMREEEQRIEFWEGRVRPEAVAPGTAAWERHRLHNAANLHHLQERLRVPREECRVYHVAWTGGAVLYDREKLVDAGGFAFWRELPEAHAGEDVLAQLRVMARYGGCGLFPSGVYHQEVPTTITDRRIDAPRIMPVGVEIVQRDSSHRVTAATEGCG